jgi:hypothetical protein
MCMKTNVSSIMNYFLLNLQNIKNYRTNLILLNQIQESESCQ